MQTAYRDDSEAAAAQVRAILDENGRLRTRVRALESQLAAAGPRARRWLWVALGLLLGALGTAALIGVMLVSMRCGPLAAARCASAPVVAPSAVPMSTPSAPQVPSVQSMGVTPSSAPPSVPRPVSNLPPPSGMVPAVAASS